MHETSFSGSWRHDRIGTHSSLPVYLLQGLLQIPLHVHGFVLVRVWFVVLGDVSLGDIGVGGSEGLHVHQLSVQIPPSFPTSASVSSSHISTSSRLLLEGVGVEHGVDGGFWIIETMLRRSSTHQRLLRIQRTAWKRWKTSELESTEVGVSHLGSEMSFDQVNLGVHGVLQRGAVPPSLTKLILTLINGSHRSQSN